MSNTIILHIPDDCDLDEALGCAVENIGFRLHEAEADAKGAEFDNLGWSVDASEISKIGIASKMVGGKVLETTYDAETGTVKHEWKEYNSYGQG